MDLIREFIVQRKKQKTDLSISTEHNQKEPKIIDLGDPKVSKSTGGSVPNTPSSTSPSQEPLKIIQTMGTSSSDYQNIFSKFLEIKQKI